ncbi:hypothetical protein [Hydrogenophaga sp.]|uniref:hypothetical protein n=1 Tax=Hydrogenophaga sp. TaxID=1904254 RepID=UPI0025C46CF1|nr:hypothetical protein [Hydrogenophaga sp.]MBT9466670.1 hypothetical protein [Hydrogenophaga sp.]
MNLRTHLPASPTRLTLGFRWLVLLALIVGTVMASMGSVTSHGLAALAAMHQDAHSHEEDTGTSHPSGTNTTADHAHHSADHSHDKAHALPHAWACVAAHPPSWLSAPRPWIERVQTFRLDRPPMV